MQYPTTTPAPFDPYSADAFRVTMFHFGNTRQLTSLTELGKQLREDAARLTARLNNPLVSPHL